MNNWKQQVDDFKAGLKVEGPSLAGSTIRFGFFGSVGGGKSVTAGIFAIGITPTGLIGWVDGEGRRSGYAIDTVAEMAAKKYGGTKASWEQRFKVVHLDPPFNPLRGVAAIEHLEEIGCKTIVLDAMSQLWDSDGGYLDLKADELDRTAGDDEHKRERKAASAAAHVKPWTHGKLVNKINASKANLVLLFQAKQKYNPKTFKPDEFTTPIQESMLTRTALAVGRVEAQMVGDIPVGGFCTFRGAIEQGTKHTHPSILAMLPKNGEQFTFAHAEAVAAWVNGSQKTQPAQKPQPESERSTLVKKLWTLTDKIHLGNKQALEQWLIDEACMSDTETLSGLTVERLPRVIELAEAKLNKPVEQGQLV
jgi:hypothetical protein